jgi:hypothetical protein
VTGALSATGIVTAGDYFNATAADNHYRINGTTIIGGSGTALYIKASSSVNTQVPNGSTITTVSSTGLAVTGEVAPSTLRFNRSNGAAWDSNGIRFQIDGTTYSKIGMNDGSNLRISSGLVVDGALSASGAITSTVASGEFLAAASATTGTIYARFQNTGGASYIGLDNSAGGAFGTGAAYALVSYVPTGRVIENMVNGATITTVSSTGLAVTGALSCTGALSKGSGSFRIEHPLPEKSATHQLVHSFIEGPQADLIYRGKVVLVDGKASVNIDSAAIMTEGTFEVLCRDVQCFTTNETGWTAVRGKVTGNILTIEAKDADCTDEISWMVIGERQDPHMMETDWTDDNGKVIVEPLKPETQSN